MKTKEKRPVSRTGNSGRPVRRRRRSDNEVVYTPAPHFDKFRFLLRLATVVAVVLALTLGMAIFFKVEVINVAGMEKYTAWDIREASGIQEGENLLTMNKAKAGGKITTLLPYVDTVKIGIKLPDTVNIEITELTVVYAIEDAEGGWWLMDAEGVVVDETTGIASETYTRIQGVQIALPTVGQPAVAMEPEQPTQDPEDATEEDTQEPTDGETETIQPVLEETPVTVFAAEQLNLAVSILQELEANGIIGSVTKVDVTDTYDLQLWYEDRYQVFLGDSSRLSYKINAMENAVGQMTDYQRGELDVSFTQWPDKVGYTPFEE